MLIDTHCHLDFPELAADREGVLARAAAAGVGPMVTIGTHKSRFQTYIDIANAHANIFCTLGVHPHHAEEAGENVTADGLIDAVQANPRVVGIGETGLDYYYDHSDRTAQQRSFSAHIAAAQETQLPLIIHNRNSDADMAEMLVAAYRRKPMPGLLHCFSSGEGLARAALDIGFYISFSGILTFKNADAVRAVAAFVPEDRLLVETDAPYLAPVPMRGNTNEPAYVVHTLQVLASLRGVSPERMAAVTTANAWRVFARMGTGA